MDGDRRKRHGTRPRAEALEAKALLSVTPASQVIAVGDGPGAAVLTLQHDADSFDSPTGGARVSVVPVAGGTAVAGVDYQPFRQDVTIGPAETSKGVAIPVLPASPARGTRTLELLVDDGHTPQVVTVAIAHGPDRTPPTTTGARAIVRRGRVTAVVVTFGKDMDPLTAGDASNYAVVDPRSIRPVPHVEWTTAKALPLAGAQYDPATRSVTLTLKRPARPALFYLIESRPFFDETNLVGQVKSPADVPVRSFASPITDTAGNPLDGDGDGVPDGTLYVLAPVGRAGRRLAALANAGLASGGPAGAGLH